MADKEKLPRKCLRDYIGPADAPIDDRIKQIIFQEDKKQGGNGE